MTPLDVSRFFKQWNKEYIVMRFGIYVYQGNDVISTIQPTINSMFGYDKASKNFTEYTIKDPRLREQFLEVSYKYNETYNIYESMAEDEAFMEEALDDEE